MPHSPGKRVRKKLRKKLRRCSPREIGASWRAWGGRVKKGAQLKGNRAAARKERTVPK